MIDLFFYIYLTHLDKMNESTVAYETKKRIEDNFCQKNGIRLPYEYIALLSIINEGRKGKIVWGGEYIISSEKFAELDRHNNENYVTRVFGWGKKKLVKWCGPIMYEDRLGNMERTTIHSFPYVVSGGQLWILKEPTVYTAEGAEYINRGVLY